MSFSQVPFKAILAGGLSALLLISAPFFLPFSLLYSNLVQLPLLSIGLSTGFRDGAIATFTAAVLLILSGAGGHSFASFLLLNGGPALLFLYFALKNIRENGKIYWYPPGRLLSILLFYAIVLAGGVAYAIQGLGLFDRISEAIGLLTGGDGPRAPDPEQEIALKAFYAFFKSYAPFLIGASLFLVTTLNGILAQALLVKFGKNLRPSPKMQEILLPWWVWYMAAGTALIGFLFGDTWFGLLSLNIFYLTLTAFFFEGLGVLHSVAKRGGNGRLFLWTLYFVLALMIGLVVIVVAIGIFEPWLRLRERIKNQ